MEELLIKLLKNGNDIEGALKRFSQDSDLYISLLPYAIEEKIYKNLDQSLSEGNIKDAYENAHSLKGMLGNMGLTKMYNSDCLIVEALKKGIIDDGVKKNYQLLMAEREIIKEIISEK